MRRFSPLRTLLPAVLLALPASGSAQLVKIDFNEYSSPTTTEYQATIGIPLTSKGIDFYETSLFNGNNSRNVLGTWGTADAGAINIPTNANGATGMFATSTAGLEIDMYPAGTDPVLGTVPNAFTLYRMDVAHLYSNEYAPFTLAPITLTFRGISVFSATTIQQSFTIQPPPVVGGAFRYPVYTTLLFDARWTGLLNVWWIQGTGSGSSHQFTNIVLYNGFVPEPGTWVMVITGLAALAVVARRRRSGTG